MALPGFFVWLTVRAAGSGAGLLHQKNDECLVSAALKNPELREH
jgi:hypothetical protein